MKPVFSDLEQQAVQDRCLRGGSKWGEPQDHAGFLPGSTCQTTEQKEGCQGKHSSFTKLRRLKSEFGEFEVAGNCGGTDFQRGDSYAEREPRKSAQGPHSISVDSHRQMYTRTFHVGVEGQESCELNSSQNSQSWGSLGLLTLECNVLMNYSGHSSDIYLISVTEMSWWKGCSDPALTKFFLKKLYRIKLSQKYYINTYQKKIAP